MVLISQDTYKLDPKHFGGNLFYEFYPLMAYKSPLCADRISAIIISFFRMLTPRNRKKFVIWWRRGGRRQCWWTGSLAGCSPPASYCSTSSTGLCSGTTTSGDQLHLVKLTWTLLQQWEKIINNRFNFYSNISTVVIKVPCQKLYSSKFMSL